MAAVWLGLQTKKNADGGNIRNRREEDIDEEKKRTTEKVKCTRSEG